MRPTRAIVRLDNIVHNLGVAARLAPGSKNVPVIKANAYGHGAVEVARALAPHAPALAVAFMDEAVALREAGIDHPLLVLQGPSARSDVELAAAEGFWLMLHRPGQVDWLANVRLARPVTTWLKVDTGMHRLGLAADEIPPALARLESRGNVHGDVVLSTHLSRADETDQAFTREQLALFQSLTLPHERPRSIANSAGILFWPEAHAEWNRPGYMLYGQCPSNTASPSGPTAELRAAMTMQSAIISVRDLAPGEGVGYGQRWRAERPSRIGTVAIGYGDGYPRHAPSGTPVWVRGCRAPLVGTVSMDMITVDLTDVAGADVGDEVELWGEHVPVNEVAALSGTIGYELLAGLTGRVPLTT
ncbi:alanine racemase [Marinihelvus fidelis]|uniref:Alanine racemase n=1 Tax=Marinihelvus fidelis TaxID=2613842 RepID=A0A5N0TDM6_9GAMM|nr:alanine racemase [Marinihelvus fidelis]KAA9132788.1 alanine racemase [Marinihelvus fidelis]